MLKIYFTFFSYLLFLTDVVHCIPDYVFNDKADGWFNLHRIPAPWEEAFLRCHYEGAVLASPLRTSNLAFAMISHLANADVRSIFLGTRDLFSKGDFVSVEGVPISDMDILMISGGTGDCLTMHPDGSSYQIYAESCKSSLPYMCYRKLDNSTMNECGTFDNEYQLNERTGSCYKVHKEERTWSTAYRICASEGGYLVILNDREEAHFITELFPPISNSPHLISEQRFHTGLLAWGDDRTWITIHGEGIKDVFHERTSRLAQDQEDYATLTEDGALEGCTSTSRNMFVCEKSPDSIRFEPVPLGL